MTARPTLREIARARPRRGSGAPARCASHKSAILALLRERGARGVLSSELYDHPEKFGRSPRNRVSELRQEGFLIAGELRGTDWWYALIRDNRGVPSVPEHSRPVEAVQPAETPFMRRRREEREQAAPLFAGLGQ